MPLIGISIEKETQFHGQAERFSNQYYYDCGAAFEDADAAALIAAVANAEKLVHSGEVAFKLGRAWTAGGTPAQNEQIALIDLTGTGLMSATQTLAAEVSVMVEWECSRKDIRGRKVYLRKFLRPQALPAADQDGARQKVAIRSDNRTVFNTYADDVESFLLGIDTLCTLCSESRNFPIDVGNGQPDVMLRTREFRRN